MLLDEMDGTAGDFAFPHRSYLEIGLHILLDVSSALTHLHQQGLVHMDLSLDKIGYKRVGEDPTDVQFFVMGFGSMQDTKLGANLNDLTGTTPKYRAPEVLRCQSFSPKSDIYSLFVCLAELCCWVYNDQPEERYGHFVQEACREDPHTLDWADMASPNPNGRSDAVTVKNRARLLSKLDPQYYRLWTDDREARFVALGPVFDELAREHGEKKVERLWSRNRTLAPKYNPSLPNQRSSRPRV